MAEGVPAERGPSIAGFTRRFVASWRPVGEVRYTFGRATRLIGSGLVLVGCLAAASLVVWWHPHTITLRGPCLAIALAMLPAALLSAGVLVRAPDVRTRRHFQWWVPGIFALMLAHAAFGIGVDPVDGGVAPYVLVSVLAAVVLAMASLLAALRTIVDLDTLRADILTGLVGSVALWACASILLVELGPSRVANSAWLLGAVVATAPGMSYIGSRVHLAGSPALRQDMRLSRVFAASIFVYLAIAMVGVIKTWPGFEPLTAPFVALTLASLTLMPLWHRADPETAAADPLKVARARHGAFVIAPVLALTALSIWVWLRPHSEHVTGPLLGYLLTTCALLAVHGIFTSRESETLRRELHHLATHDELTGLWNRRQGELLVAAALDQLPASAIGVAVITVDLDGFKDVNDRYGHPAGDRLLCEVAGALRRATRRGDSVCRFGGDEFVILCPGIVDESEANAAAERVVAAVRGLQSRSGQVEFGAIAASAGVVFVDHWVPPAVAVAAADQALLRAKRQGRDRVSIGRVPVSAAG
jgi:diguanylate cyclase (GGDEF)-like protein